jgi:hypothetical protein
MLRIAGSGSGIFPSGASGSTWLWNPTDVSRANQHWAPLFDTWGVGCFETPRCGSPWNCSSLQQNDQHGCNDTAGHAGAVGEWGYQFANFDCSESTPCCNLTSRMCSLTPPSTRAEAMLRMQRYFVCRQRAAIEASAKSGQPGYGFSALSGHYFYPHHAIAFGASPGGTRVTFLSSEVAENINSVNAHLAFLRGAARQYGVDWGVDVSPWFGGCVPDFANASHAWAGTASKAGPNGGHSVSLLRRIYFAVAAAGAHELSVESGDCYAFLPTRDPATGVFALSPIGQMISDFARLPRARGTAYTPLAVLFEDNHGMGLGWWYESRSFQTMAKQGLPLTVMEQTATHLFELLWPRSWRPQWGGTWQTSGHENEENMMVASPLAEIVDVLSPRNLSAVVVARYQAILLAGDVEVDKLMEPQVLETYLRSGGTVVAFAAQVETSRILQRLFADSGIIVGAKTVVNVSYAISSTNKWVEPVQVTPRACVPIYGASGVVWTGQWYIKVGGDRSKMRGWDSGVLDRCCLPLDSSDSSNNSTARCLTFASVDRCEQALSTVTCDPCATGERSLGCPQWIDSAEVSISKVDTGGGYMPGSSNESYNNSQSIQILSQFVPSGTAVPVPAVVQAQHSTGGKLVLILVDDVPTLQAFRLLNHTLQLVASPYLPFQLVDANTGADIKPKIQLMFNRWPSSFRDGKMETRYNLTLINNNGLSKTPMAPPMIDDKASETMSLQAINACIRSIVQVWPVTKHTAREAAKMQNLTEVKMTIAPGGIILLAVTVTECS